MTAGPVDTRGTESQDDDLLWPARGDERLKSRERTI